MFQSSDDTSPTRGIVMRLKSVRDIPLFPLVPIVPALLLVGSLVIAIRALVRVNRLERRLNAAPV
jgi:hypothetical protein